MRAVTVVAILQFCAVLLGWCALALTLRLDGYPGLDALNPRWRPITFGLREHGLWLLLFVPVWTLLAALCVERFHSELVDSVLLIVGMAVVLFVLAVFLSTAANPRLPRGLLISPPRPASDAAR